MAKKGNDRADQDSPWKQILKLYFRDAMEFFFPQIAEDIDWSHPIDFLNKEYQQLTPNSEIGKRVADQLVKVYQKGGNAIILLIHLEVQAEPEDIFPERVFTYMLRIFDYFHQIPISLVILCDQDTIWRPHQYRVVTAGSSVEFNFTSVKLLDYRSNWSDLEASQNVFAIVVMTHLKAQETQRSVVRRKEWKLRLVQSLYNRGYDRSAILSLFTFVDWVMILLEAAKVEFWQELKVYEEERKMSYITSVEQIGYDRGMKVGEERGEEKGAYRQARSIVLRQLSRKFGTIAPRLEQQIEELSVGQLDILTDVLLDFESIADLTSWLDNQEAVRSLKSPD